MARLTPLEQTLHTQFATYGRCAREWMRRCVLLLPEIDRHQIWRKKRCSSIYEYAAKLAGMSRYTVDEALRVLKKIEDKPDLLKLVEEKGLNRVKPIATLATAETQEFWIEKVNSMGKTALETYVKNYRSEILPRKEPQPEKEQISLVLKPALAQKLKQLQKRADFEEVLEKALNQIGSDSPPSVKNNSRYIPKAIKEHVTNRTSGLCSYPSCHRPATSLHHTQRFALEKVHDPARLRPLCTAHERLAHLGLIENEEKSPESWKLRKEPDRNDPKFYIDTLVSLYRHPT